MLYPSNIEQKIGFDKIREIIKQNCISSLGKRFAEKIRFSDDFDIINKLVRQTAEFKEILILEPDFPSSNYIDATPSLSKAAIEGTFLIEDEFFDVKLSLQTIHDCLRFFKNQDENQFANLRNLTEGIEIEKQLLAKINSVIDERGKLKDNASTELQQIRKQIISEQSGLRKKLDSILKSAKSNGYVSEDASPTIRNGRMVIPVTAEFKKRIKGFVQDESSTGQTLFIEPVEILESNNEIRELEYAEKREIIKILTLLTDNLRPYIPQLKKAYIFLGIVDFLRAKAKFAIDINAINPHFSNQPLVNWENTYHPLLYISHRNAGKQIVPLNLKLDSKYRLLLISGPNAGGKSVTLKTVGLIQYMFQCGLLIPVAENTKIGLFKNIFIDIGDEQSLENDLSTYSSHLSNMKHFIKFANKNTLFLIDEFGTGTEPGMGGAIAESILQKLNEAKAFGVINTHYTNLKLFAEHNEGIQNGAMRFDTQNLEPLYLLEIGKPGSSFAFEIAHKIGLPQEVIANAKIKAGEKQVDFDQLLRDLEVEKRNLSQKNQELKIREKDLKKLQLDYETLKFEIETNRKQLINKAKQEAKDLVANANKKIESTIREIIENKAEKVSTKKLRNELEFFENELQPEIIIDETDDDENEEIEVINGEIVVGNLVRVKGQNASGEVLSIKGKDVEIRIGSLKSNIKLNRLEKITRKEFKKQIKEFIPPMKGIDMNEKMSNFSYQLDLRGKRTEEALPLVDDLIDDAIMLNQTEVRIVHGKGDGILRTLVRNHLKQYSQISSMTDEHADRGGAGVTIIKMK